MLTLGTPVLAASIFWCGQENRRILRQPSSQCGISRSPIRFTIRYHFGCGSRRRDLSRLPRMLLQRSPTITTSGNARYDSLEVKAEQERAAWSLCAARLYLVADIRFRHARRLGTLPGAIYWPLPGTKRLTGVFPSSISTTNFTASVLYDLPFGKGKHFGSEWNGAANAVLGNWQVI